jgi:hypothetical protein
MKNLDEGGKLGLRFLGIIILLGVILGAAGCKKETDTQEEIPIKYNLEIIKNDNSKTTLTIN